MQRLWGLLHASEGSSIENTHAADLVRDQRHACRTILLLMHYGDTLNNASMPDFLQKRAHSRTIGYFLDGRSIGSRGISLTLL